MRKQCVKRMLTALCACVLTLAAVAALPGAVLSVSATEDAEEDDEDDDEEEETVAVTADHFLMVGGNWVTPIANAGQTVSIVLPVVNMGKTDVSNAVVTPVLSTDSTVWPFEITQSSYSQTIEDLPGTNTGMSDMDRHRELTWNLTTRDDVGSGYLKISFDVRYFASDGTSQSTTLDTYIQTNGTAGVSADGSYSTPRVIVTGFETDPEEVHAGESFVLTLHLKNTSTSTSVSNMLFEFSAVVTGSDSDTTYESFLPTAGSNTIFVDKMERNGTKDIEIELEARSDLAQKPYAIDVNMSYEDEKVNSYTNTASVSIPVKQEARVDMSEPEVTPTSIEVGSESNVMFEIYNLGKTKLYNVTVKAVADSVSGGEAFIGNLDSGATGSVDMYLTGAQATMDEGIVTLEISYEDESGEATVIEKEIELYVSEAYEDYYMDDFDMEEMETESGGSSPVVVIVVIALLLVAAAVVIVILKMKKKKKQQKLEEDLLDLDDDDTEL
ncbi:MAG: hypothetical protein LUE24_05820 [Lachnospiraceae bacterium]|nr:hypothetical protein [Lachnospiraceae bacterium]